MGKLTSTLLLSATLLLAAPFAHADWQCSTKTNGDTLLGVDPFPLDCPLPFPWLSIEGNWELKGAGVYTAYSFEKQSSCEGRDILRIRQFQVITGEVVSEGIGFKEANSENVKAVMNGKTGGHMLYVGRYLNKEVNPPEPANVLRVVPLDKPQAGRGWEILKFPRDLAVRVPNKDHQAAMTCVNDPE